MKTSTPRSVRFSPEVDAHWAALHIAEGNGAAVINLAMEIFFAHLDAGAHLRWHVPEGEQKAKPVLMTPDEVALEGKRLLDQLRELYGTQLVQPNTPHESSQPKPEVGGGRRQAS